MNIMHCSQSNQLYQRNIPDANCFKDYIGSKGISNKHHLIIYDRSPYGFYSSTRLWWLLRVFIIEKIFKNSNRIIQIKFNFVKLYGHENITILNGGLNKWYVDIHELTKEIPEYKVILLVLFNFFIKFKDLILICSQKNLK